MANSDLKDVTRLGLKLGVTAFGGPAAHIAMLRQDVVERHKWLTEPRFLDLLGITNLIPGPNSTEMVMHIGQERAGTKGLVAAGVAFIAPAALITLFFAWLYMEFGTTTQGTWVLLGVKPVVLAVVGQAIWNLGRTAIKSVALAAIGAGVLLLYLLGVNELVLLFGGAMVAFGIHAVRSLISAPTVSLITPWVLIPTLARIETEVTYSLVQLFLTFLKIGAVLYGSGYVLLAFIEGDFVDRLGWLSNQQLLDAVAVGQFTPGPVFTTATFVGYVLGGVPGAIAATIAIFLPAFVFVALAHRFLNRMMNAAWTRPLLDGVNVAAIGLMAAVGLSLARDAVFSWLTAALFAIALLLLVRVRINSALLVLGGALISVAVNYLG